MKNTLKAERSRKQLTQAQLAELVGVSRQTIISIEISRYVPSITLSLKLALALDIDVAGIFHLEDSD